MSLAAPSRRRQIPVRLCDLPHPVRMDGARVACRVEPDPGERVKIVAAAVFPSDRVYYVARMAA